MAIQTTQQSVNKHAEELLETYKHAEKLSLILFVTVIFLLIIILFFVAVAFFPKNIVVQTQLISIATSLVASLALTLLYEGVVDRARGHTESYARSLGIQETREIVSEEIKIATTELSHEIQQRINKMLEEEATRLVNTWPELLPKEYFTQPERKFPVLYWISGYGGDYHNYSGRNDSAMPMDTTPCIRVFLDGNCPGGHSVYANSDNNGPWGDALTKELIPLVEKNYRTNAARLLTGHSSGGWTVLWLQTHYPKVFMACWSSSPDPVDFRSFQQIDLYKDKNMIYAKDSTLRLAGTIAGRFPWITMKNMYAMEHVIWRGEQMHSFNFVFSTKNSDGTPRSLINEATGDIDPVTFDHWKNYDISLYVRTNWQQLKPDLQGKIRVSVGNQDNFLLNYPVHLLDDEMKKIDAGFMFGYYPGDHFTVSTPEYRTAGYQFLQQKYNESGIK